MKSLYYIIMITMLFGCGIFKKDGTKLKNVEVEYIKKEKEKFTNKENVLNPFFEGLILYEQERFQEAKKEFIKSIEKDKNFAPAIYWLAKTCYELRDYKCAMENFEKAYEINPDNKWYAIEYADILKKNNEYLKAAEILTQVYEKNPNDLKLLVELTNLYIQFGKYEKALKLLDKLEAIGMEREAIDQKIRIFLQQGNITDAINTAKKMANKNPSEMLWLQHIVNLYSFIGENDSVKFYLNKMLKIKPDYLFALRELLNIYIKEQNYEKAKELLTRIVSSKIITPTQKISIVKEIIMLPKAMREKIDIDNTLKLLIQKHPDNNSVLVLFADYFNANNKKDSALVYYKKALLIDDSNPILWEQIINMEIALNRYDSVEKYCKEALTIFPEQISFMYSYALALTRQKKYEKAEKYLKRIEKIGTSDNSILLSVYLMLGEVYHYMKDYEKSTLYFEKAIEKFPENPTALNNYAYFLSLRNENLDKAESMIKKVLNSYPNVPAYLDTYGWILYKKGKYKEALKYIEKAYKLSNNPDPEIIDHLGDVYLKLNNVEKALKFWNEAYKKSNNDEIYQKIRKYNTN